MKIGKSLTSGKRGDIISVDVDKEYIKQAILEKFANRNYKEEINHLKKIIREMEIKLEKEYNKKNEMLFM